MPVTEPGAIVHLHCVAWEWGRQETYPLLNSYIFVLSHQRWHTRVHGKPDHTRAHKRVSASRKEELPHFKGPRPVHKANGGRRQIRRGTWVLLQRQRKRIGRTFNLPQLWQIAHPEEMTSRGWLWPCRVAKQKIHCCPRYCCPRHDEVVFPRILGFLRLSGFFGVLCC